MIRLSILCTLSLAFAWLLCYGAMQLARNVAEASRQRNEMVMP